MNAITPVHNSITPVIPTNTQSICALVTQTLEAKEKLAKKAPNKHWVDSAVLVGGDIFTVGYFALTTVSKFAPATRTMSGMIWATALCGGIAGVINILVALVSLKHSIQAFANGDKKLGYRLLWDFVVGLLLGTTLILSATALKIAALGAVGAFLAQPWVYPLLFFVCEIFLVLDLIKRERSVITQSDLASKICNETGKSSPFFDISEELSQAEPAGAVITRKMEQLQAEMGTAAALAAFRLWKAQLEQDLVGAATEMHRLKQEVEAWNHSLHVRSFQQGLYIVGAVLGTGFGISPKVLDTINTTLTATGNGIALWMDLFWPFKRNTPIVVPKVETWDSVYQEVFGTQPANGRPNLQQSDHTSSCLGPLSHLLESVG